MGIFWWKKNAIEDKLAQHKIGLDDPKAAKQLKQAHDKADEASEKVNRLNRLLKADGITLLIHIATTERRRR